MKRTLLVISLVLVLSMILSACGAGEPANHLEAIEEKGKMVVGTSADFPPYEYVAEDGSFAGFDIALIQEIGDRMGLEVEIVDMPFDSLLAAIQEGKIDLTIAALSYTEERDQQVDFTDPYDDGHLVIVVRDDFNGDLDTKEKIAEYKLGGQAGSTADIWFTENLIEPGLISENNIFRYERNEQGLLDLKAGRIDVFLTDDTPADIYVEEMGELKIITNPEFFPVTLLSIAVPEGDAELLEALNGVIADLKEEGVVEDLIMEWMQAK